MQEHIAYLIQHFGYFGIIIALVGGIVGLPVPDEVLLTYVGFNVFQGRLSYVLSLGAAFLGAVGGITLSYFLGYKFGLPLLEKFGPKVHIKEKQINRTKRLFQKIGPCLLIVGYFIPGVRHLTAFLSAVNRFPFRKFMVYAYSGAFIWCFTFITLGRILGKNWTKVEPYLLNHMIYIILITCVLLLMVYLIGQKKINKQ